MFPLNKKSKTPKQVCRRKYSVVSQTFYVRADRNELGLVGLGPLMICQLKVKYLNK